MLQVKQASRQSVWPALCALGASALAAYAVVAWFLQIQSLQSPATQVPVVLSVASGNVSSDGNADAHVAFALGAPKPAGKDTGNSAQAAHQWNFLGVVASASGQGAALIGVDGQAPKAFLPGQTLAPGWVLHSVGHRLARLAPDLQSTPTVTLELPK
jgi:general secretion pathway protein C